MIYAVGGICLPLLVNPCQYLVCQPNPGDHLECGANGEHPEEAQQTHRSQTKKWEHKGKQEKQVHSRCLRVMPPS
jgi:hypothetical protein